MSLEGSCSVANFVSSAGVGGGIVIYRGGVIKRQLPHRCRFLLLRLLRGGLDGEAVCEDLLEGERYGWFWACGECAAGGGEVS